MKLLKPKADKPLLKELDPKKKEKDDTWSTLETADELSLNSGYHHPR